MANSLDLSKLRSDLSDAGSPWEMDENTSLALMSEEERVRMLGFTPPPDAMSIEEAIRLDKTSTAVTAEQITAESSIGIPVTFDHRNINGKNFTTPVKNQGGCGSCVAHGVCAVMETTYKRSTNQASLNLDLSEAHLFYCHGGEEGRTCASGWWPSKAFAKAKDKGVTLETVYPYTPTQQACSVPSEWQNNMAKVTGNTQLEGRTAIKNWIATHGSVTGCFIVYQDFFSYKSGVYRHVSGTAAGGHCVEIIGYNDSQRCWICKNSWGTNWGEAGFFRIAYGQCRIEEWAGPFGANAVTLRRWAKNLKVNGLWSNTTSCNAHVHFTGIGWRKVATTNETTHCAMLTQLIGAKAANRTVNALLDGNKIVQAYVI